VGRGAMIVKQKRRAGAAFLGILTISRNVLRACCILTTIFEAFLPLKTTSETRKATPATHRNTLYRESNFPVKTRLRSPRRFTKKAAAMVAAAF
jgi:hypothetical protein